MNRLSLLLLITVLITIQSVAQQFRAVDQGNFSAIPAKKKQLYNGMVHHNLFFNNVNIKTGKIIDAKTTFFPISPRFVVENWGIVCRQELKMQRSLGLPLYFRLGSLQHVDALEGKYGRSENLKELPPTRTIR